MVIGNEWCHSTVGIFLPVTLQLVYPTVCILDG